MIINLEYNNRHYHAFSKSELRAEGVPESVINEALFNAAKRQKLSEIKKKAQAKIDFLLADYPQGIINSFSKQEAEARAFIADNNSATPHIDGLVSKKGSNKQDQATRIIFKADLFAAASGEINGSFQKSQETLESLEFNAHSLEDIIAIK